ncbi:kinesin light chain 1 [Apiospora arundinis]
MRLLQRQSDGSLCLTRDFVDAIPPYAILSHTWGDDDQEVTFQDMKEGTGRHKDGYHKIEFCGAQAAADGLDHFWVDTCCIDKANNTELQEAINSMFRWYQNSAKCYVYLPDVLRMGSGLAEDLPRPTWKLALRGSRWFTRGWTLQELLAPSSVEFFSQEGQRLGDKGSLKNLLHDITGIPISALQGTPLSDFSETERMSWSDTRKTKKEEDMAYSLLGLFGVHMPMIYGEGKQNALRRLREEIGKESGLRGLPRSLHTQPETSKKSHFLVPFGQNEGFVGREPILAQLLEKIPPSTQKNDCQRTVVEGLGGIGKTQIALEAVYRVRDLYSDCSVFWVPVVNSATFENAYREIGQALAIQAVDDDKTDIKALVKVALSGESAGSWLMVIDNADDAGLFFDERNGASIYSALPFSRKGSILFTTRNHAMSTRLDVPPRSVIAVEGMTRAEATEMLHVHLKESQADEASTEQLVNFLAYLPLAIKQASSYMDQTGINTTKYLSYCRSNKTQAELLRADFQDRSRYPEIANPIAITWTVSFNHIADQCPLAAEYLKLICYLAEKDIPTSLLPGKDGIEKDKAIGVLKGYAFIIEREASDSFDIHRLVRLAMRNWIKSQDLQRDRITKSLKSLASAFPFPKHENRNVWLEYLPHTQAALELQMECADQHAQWILLFNTAESHSILGKYGEAERLYRSVLELSEKVLGREHPSTLTSMNNLAEVLRQQGKYEEAEQMHRQTLELRKKVLGREHPDTLTSIMNIGNSLGRQGKYGEAEQMHRQTLELREKVLGRGHPDTLASINNLALVLGRQGKYGEAEQMHRQTLELREKVLGREHPATLDSINALAIVLSNQGNQKDAALKQRQALEGYKRILGEGHPRTLESTSNLAFVLDRQGKYEEAEQMHRQTLELREKVLGREHPETIKSKRSLQATIESQADKSLTSDIS